MRMYLTPLHHLSSLLQVFQTTVSAGTDNDLIDLDMAGLKRRMCIFRQMRIRNDRHQII